MVIYTLLYLFSISLCLSRSIKEPIRHFSLFCQIDGENDSKEEISEKRTLNNEIYEQKHFVLQLVWLHDTFLKEC